MNNNNEMKDARMRRAFYEFLSAHQFDDSIPPLPLPSWADDEYICNELRRILFPIMKRKKFLGIF